MKTEEMMSDESLLQLIGGRLARLRLAKNLTQEQLAEQAGLGFRTVQRMESGEAATQLSGFFRVCRILGLLERLDALIPEQVASCQPDCATGAAGTRATAGLGPEDGKERSEKMAVGEPVMIAKVQLWRRTSRWREVAAMPPSNTTLRLPGARSRFPR